MPGTVGKLTIQESDGTPSGKPSVLKVSNGTLTDNGDGTFTLNASGAVSSVSGTTNQVTASPTTGAVVLTTPQNIHTAATPQFARMGLGEVSNAGYRLNAAGAGKFVNQETSGSTSGSNTLIKTGGPNTIGLEVQGTLFTTTFDPNSVTGIKFFFKADALALNDGDAVGTWTDSSTNGNDITQATAANKPTYKTNIINSKPVVRFDGTNDFLTRAAVGWSTDAVMVFVVTKYTISNYGMFVNYGINTAGTWNLRENTTTGKPEFIKGSTNEGALDTTDRSGAWHILMGNVTTGNDWNLYTDATLVSGPNSFTFTHSVSETLVVGRRDDPGFYLNGDIAEIIAYDNTLSTADRQSVEGYLAHKYGLTANLPSDHPYKVTAPGTNINQTANLQIWTHTSGSVLSAVYPTGGFLLPAGTTAYEPLKFTSGVNLTTAKAGAMEYNGTNLFFTRTGTTRENVMTANAVNSVSPTSPNRTITVIIDGSTYYLAAKTTND